MRRLGILALLGLFTMLLTLHPTSAQDAEPEGKSEEKPEAKAADSKPSLAKGQRKDGVLDSTFWKLYGEAAQAIDVEYGDGLNFDKRVAAPQEFEIPLVADFIDKPLESFEATAEGALGYMTLANLSRRMKGEGLPDISVKVDPYMQYVSRAEERFPGTDDLWSEFSSSPLPFKALLSEEASSDAELRFIALAQCNFELRESLKAIEKISPGFSTDIQKLRDAMIGKGEGLSREATMKVVNAFMLSKGAEDPKGIFAGFHRQLDKGIQLTRALSFDLGGELDLSLPANALYEFLVGGARIVVAGRGNHQHKLTGDEALVVDFGGDDTYSGIIATATPSHPLAMLHDYSGNDTYTQDKGKPGLASGLGGLGILLDYGGDDVFRAGDFSLGAGCFGIGVLNSDTAERLDSSSEDTYIGGQFTQGAGYAGVGMLQDWGNPDEDGEDTTKKRSNDSYRCDRYGQGFGYVAGYGLLQDSGGNDRYDAGGRYRHTPLLPDSFQSLSQGMGFGSRGNNFAGGIGVLDDQGTGNDTYNAEVYGQGASYWYALGVLRDGGGNDRYTMTQYGQGAGIHLSAGILIDEAGNDCYYNFNGVGTGGAHDYAVGFLVDKKGNDAYYSNGLAQGLNNSVAMLYDAEGDDTYASRAHNGIGFAHNLSIAMLIDGAGKDRYSIPMQDGIWRYRGDAGVIVEGIGPKDEALTKAPIRLENLIQRVQPKKAESVTKSTPKKPAKPGPVVGSDKKKRDNATLETIWKRACDWQVGSQKNKDEILQARRTLVEIDDLPFLLTHLGESYGLNLRAIRGTIPHYGNAALPPLMKELETPENYWRFRNALDCITLIYSRQAKDVDKADAREHINELLPKVLAGVESLEESKRFGVLEFLNRYNAGATTVEDMKVDLLEMIEPFFASKKDRTRLAAVKLAQKLPMTPKLMMTLEVFTGADPYHGVRLQASRTRPYKFGSREERANKLFREVIPQMGDIARKYNLVEACLERRETRGIPLNNLMFVMNDSRAKQNIFLYFPPEDKEADEDTHIVYFRHTTRTYRFLRGKKDLLTMDSHLEKQLRERIKKLERLAKLNRYTPAELGALIDLKDAAEALIKANS